tara:strand:+ start:293 stop:580 length:288 start_codon:yes stop_codon:yes gene_type:complete
MTDTIHFKRDEFQSSFMETLTESLMVYKWVELTKHQHSNGQRFGVRIMSPMTEDRLHHDVIDIYLGLSLYGAKNWARDAFTVTEDEDSSTVKVTL